MCYLFDYYDNDNNGGGEKNIEYVNGFFYLDEDCLKVGNM